MTPEPEPRTGPQLGAEHAKAQVGVGHELLELPLPRRAVALGDTVELRDVRLERGAEEHRRAVRERGPGGELGVHVLEAARVEVVGELGVRGGALEERVPRAHHLVREARQGVVGLGADRAAQAVGPLEDADAPAVAREQRPGRERVDARADEDRVEHRHAREATTVSVH